MNKVIYGISTTLLCLLFLASAMMYIFNYEYVHGAFVSLGFPTWIIYPLAGLKILGAVTVLTRFSSFLKELAYAGFLYDAVLALVAHTMVGDGDYAPAIIALLLITVSWIFERKVYGPYKQEPVAA